MHARVKQVTSKSRDFKIASEIRFLFESYGLTFSALVVGKRSDMSALLNFYGAPLRFIGSTFHMVLKDNNAITGAGGIGGEVGRLQHAHLAGSTLHKCRVKVLNDQAALVNAEWSRQGPTGMPKISSFVYLVARTEQGWRITSAVDTSAST